MIRPLVPAVDPPANGFTIVVADVTGAVVFTRNIPAGSAPDLHSSGWHVNGPHTRWRFYDATATVAGGITSVGVSDQPNVAPGRYGFALKGRGAFKSYRHRCRCNSSPSLVPRHKARRGSAGSACSIRTRQRPSAAR